MVKVRPCWPLARGWRRVTNLGGDQLIVVCVYARRRCVAAIASPPSRRRRRVAAVVLPPSRCRRRVAAVASPPSRRRRRRPCCRHPRCHRCHRRRRCRRRLMDAMVKKYVHVGRWCDDGRLRNKRQRLWLRLQYAQNCRYDDAGRCRPTNDIGTPGKRQSPPPRSIFRAAPLGSRRGNRTSHLGGDAARRAARRRIALSPRRHRHLSRCLLHSARIA